MSERLALYPVSREHLEAISDAVGIFQHARYSEPDPAHGYCTDDVSRALQVDLLHARELGWAAVSTSAWRHLDFITEAYDAGACRFRNFRHVDGSWVDAPGSEDCQGRAMHALGDAVATAPDGVFAAAAAALFGQALPGTADIRALRAVASIALGCEAAIHGGIGGIGVATTYRRLAGRLRDAFLGDGLSPEWPWPEPVVTYENGLPVRALIVAGQHHVDAGMVRGGVRALDWLIAAQTAPGGSLSPIGNGWWPAGGERSLFDQQPIESASLLLAAEAAWSATGDSRYRSVMDKAYTWFLGENDLGVQIADPLRGACCDGLTPDGANRNEGAESTLMWLTVLEHMRAVRPHPVADGSPARRDAALELAGSAS